jgi:hypothetical protein
MNVPLTQLLARKEEELKLFEFAVRQFCNEVKKVLEETQRLLGQQQVISLLSELTEKASFSAELVKLNQIPALKLKISFVEEKLEYETEPLGIVSSLGEIQLLPEEFLRSVRKFIEFLLENLWKFHSLTCETQEQNSSQP